MKKKKKHDGMKRGILDKPLQIINQLVAENLLIDYAIGGGVAALYYTEPVLTYDFDIICRFPGQGDLIDPSPVYNKLNKLGYNFGMEDRVMVEGVPLQFIPASHGLMEEALENAVPVTICGVKTRILRVEHLTAIMLNLYRPKDRAKLDLIVNNKSVSFDRRLFKNIIKHYDLNEKWKRFNES